MMLDSLKQSVHDLVEEISNVDVFYYDKAPQSTTGKYTIFHMISDTYEGNDTGNRYSDVKVQFSFFDTFGGMSSNLLSHYDETISVLDNAKSYVSCSDGSLVIDIKRDFIVPPRKIDDVWQFSVQYNYHIKND